MNLKDKLFGRRNFLVLVVAFILFVFESQSQDDKMTGVLYMTTFNLSKNQEIPFQEYSVLYVDGDKSLYQVYVVMKLDSLRANGTYQQTDLGTYFSYNEYEIRRNGSVISYTEPIGEDEYSYEENLTFNWELSNESKVIKDYNCKKATVTYGGREWIAWYTTEIAIDAGPYKFNGLPGLIVKVTDSTNSFDFEIERVQEVVKKPLKKLFYRKLEANRIITNRSTFNTLKFNYNTLSLSEKLSLGSSTGNVKVSMVGGDSTEEITSLRDNNRAKNLNLIEIDHP